MSIKNIESAENAMVVTGGFADTESIDDESYAFSQREVSNNLINKLKTKSGVKISDLETRLNLLK